MTSLRRSQAPYGGLQFASACSENGLSLVLRNGDQPLADLIKTIPSRVVAHHVLQ